MNRKTIFSLMLAASLAGYAQQGGISQKMLEQIASAYEGTPTDRALVNAIAANDVRTLALNQENLRGGLDTHFSHRVNSRGITDQESSGRCWLFTGFNVLRAKAMARHGWPSCVFSPGYSFFWDQLEKSNLFLQGIIDTRERPLTDQMVEWLLKHPLSDGGTYTGVADLVAKYGIVPAGVMPETYASNNTSRFTSLIARKLREDCPPCAIGITLEKTVVKRVVSKFTICFFKFLKSY